jgi:hypothetical protein
MQDTVLLKERYLAVLNGQRSCMPKVAKISKELKEHINKRSNLFRSFVIFLSFNQGLLNIALSVANPDPHGAALFCEAGSLETIYWDKNT